MSSDYRIGDPIPTDLSWEEKYSSQYNFRDIDLKVIQDYLERVNGNTDGSNGNIEPLEK